MFKNNSLKVNSSSQTNKLNTKQINVKVKELVLTPLTCASVINEIIKYLIYQKSQIPYPYNWLRSVVNRKRKEPENNQRKPTNLVAERHYRVVSTAYDGLQELTKHLNNEFKNYGNNIKQILVLFGATIYNPKEVFRICVTDLARGHSEDNHFQANIKNLHKILRNIVLDEEWISEMESAIPLTNIYVMVQKYVQKDYTGENNFFILNAQYSLPQRVKDIAITLHYNNEDDGQYNCCDNLSIFRDSVNEETDTASSLSESNTDSSFQCVHDSSNCNLVWFQANVVLKGFKECFINKVSATELW